MGENIPDRWAVKGPQLWRELHRWALTTDRKEPMRWLDQFAKRIGCGECKLHWLKLVRQQPPDASSNDALFAWSVRVHNTVNRHLGKAELTLEAAAGYWKGEHR